MSDPVKHECGIAMLRLRKSPGYYIDKYGTWDYGLQKMYLMMEKQHNRGQDGAGIAGIKLTVEPGNRYIFRQRSNRPDPLREIFGLIYEDIDRILNDGKGNHHDPLSLIQKIPFACDVYLGHLRYGTYGNYKIDYVHPVSRENNWRSRNLVMAGNFNLTNVSEVFDHLVDLGQNPIDFSDTVTILENVGHRLDEENERLFRHFKDEGYSKKEISPLIESNLDLATVLTKASRNWDGGYTMAGMVGHGDAFVMRDPAGIRPAFYYIDDEVVVVASERPVIQTIFNVRTDQVEELPPAHALIVKASGENAIVRLREAAEIRKCSFERIYFSRGTDKSIYRERKKLGELLTLRVLKAVNHDLDNTVFSYIPNTAESAFYGLIKGVEDFLNRSKTETILERGKSLSREELEAIINHRPRVEKIAVKDAKLRTFITGDNGREDLVGHVYDVTYGVIRRGVDNLVVIDDSIVRGTTLKKSIIKILDRLDPAKIVIVSSSPQIRYPDCYGIDMAKLGDLIAFRAAIELLKDAGRDSFIGSLYEETLGENLKPVDQIRNLVKEVYKPFCPDEISAKIASMLRTEDINSEVEIVFQSIEGLHEACPGHTGDWYFTGDYPTPGGNRVANRSFINFVEGKNVRAY
ncbi:MAG TPA: amidophosphoribosyltransferase [Bacteroidales bacterium]|nr:amidophosphoribosyltransferase [Bacteroidales bacterium]HPF03174.1 amidophosphoribosyltransferase [Bacteroidales bacterium]HPJ58122.1 amidophosphoribosyltransferase [Bacteroidales bacterium]HPR12467.1 amidophosphoribosyltransferase [Bacteroidales bacterium]HRW84532.1 amidophosphoribosyltransferase [Bacteroidales bacterium]